ncbi:MAG: laminin B domain-containing protein, partial [Nitrososphaera sp.]
VDVFLDGVEKLNDIPVGPGAITDIGISAWDRPGVVYYDNLEFCPANTPSSDSCTAVSFFDVDAKSWTVIGDVQNPAYFFDGGNPGGYISATNSGPGQIWYWQAPAKFLRDAACAYCKALNFDLRHIANIHTLDTEDVILEGGGLKLVFDTSYNPNENWTSYSVLLRENAGWRKNNLNGAPPTLAEMQATLASLSKLLIRGEFSTVAGDSGHLDNVVLNGPVRGVGPAVFLSFSVDDDNLGLSNGDGDGQPEPGEKVELGVTLQNQGILAATGVAATLSTSDPDITILKNDNTWPDIPANASQSSLDNFVFEISPTIAPGKLLFFSMTVTASNGGQWTSTFDLSMAPSTTAVEESEISAPVTSYQLEQNYPNPFSQIPRFAGNPSTMIRFALPQAGEVSLAIYNINGQLVKRLIASEMRAGRHSVIWDAKDDRGQHVTSGVYLYVLKAGNFVSQRKLVLMK